MGLGRDEAPPRTSQLRNDDRLPSSHLYFVLQIGTQPITWPISAFAACVLLNVKRCGASPQSPREGIMIGEKRQQQAALHRSDLTPPRYCHLSPLPSYHFQTATLKRRFMILNIHASVVAMVSCALPASSQCRIVVLLLC